MNDFSYYSQHGQDRFFHERFFNGFTGGIFLDVGAYDGITFSNTYFFERHLGWGGICVEPNPEVFSALDSHRSSTCENVCISDSETEVEFLCVQGYSEMLSGITSHFDERHAIRLFSELREFGGKVNNIALPCQTLSSLCDRHGISHVDLCSIDVEGAELAVLKGIDFMKVTIRFFCIENNFGEGDCEKFLRLNGYERIARLEQDDIFQLRETST